MVALLGLGVLSSKCGELVTPQTGECQAEAGGVRAASRRGDAKTVGIDEFDGVWECCTRGKGAAEGVDRESKYDFCVDASVGVGERKYGRQSGVTAPTARSVSDVSLGEVRAAHLESRQDLRERLTA